MRRFLLTIATLGALLAVAPAQSLVTPLKNPKLTGTLDVTSLSTKTGTGNLVLATSPTLVTPALGVATATSLNGLTLTSSTGTITLAAAKTLTVSNTLTLAGTDGSTLAIGAGGTLGTAAFTAASEYLSSAATAFNGLTLTASTGTLTVANGKTLTAHNTLTLAGTDGSTLTIGAGGTLGTAAYTDTTAYVASGGGSTGTGVIVYATSPTLVTPVLGVASATTISTASLTASNYVTTGALKVGLTTRTSAYTIVAATDSAVNCTSGTFTVTLPSAIGIGGQVFTIKNSGSGTITVATTSSQTIDGVTTKTIAASAYLRVMSDGANWIAL